MEEWVVFFSLFFTSIQLKKFDDGEKIWKGNEFILSSWNFSDEDLEEIEKGEEEEEEEEAKKKNTKENRKTLFFLYFFLMRTDAKA